MEQQSKIEVQVLHDYDGWFEQYVKNNILPMITNPLVKVIKVEAYPYQPYACTVHDIDKTDGSVKLTFYSAIRAGFGDLHPIDVVEYINQLD